MNITRQGRVVILIYLSGCHQKKLVLILKIKIKKCFKYCVQCSVFKSYEKDNPEIMRHCNKLNDTIINWECMKFPCSRKGIDRFEEGD